jgi:hypothetical protein
MRSAADGANEWPEYGLRLPLACARICLAMIGLGLYMITDGSGV